jgi:hypothetical protein
MATRGLQYIIDNASAIEISRRRTVAQMVTRSGRLRTAERTALQPYVLTVTPPKYARFEDVRDVIEGITMTDRNKDTWIQLSAANGMAWVTDYRGDLTTTQLNNIRANTGTTATVYGSADFNTSAVFGYTTTTNFDYVQVTNLPNIGDLDASGTAITTATAVFRAGDYIQLRTLNNGTVNWSNPRTVPLDVLRGSGTTVNVPVHRRWINITASNRTGADLYIANEIRMRMLITTLPSIRLLPGQIVEWTGNFELIEDIN